MATLPLAGPAPLPSSSAAAGSNITATPSVPSGLNPAWYTLSRLRRRKFASAISLASAQLAHNPRDEPVWFLKVRALTRSTFIDDTDLEEESIGDLLLDDAAIATAPRYFYYN